jgi:hypothetical protein
MRAPAAVSYLQAPEELLRIESIKIADKTIPTEFEVSLDGNSPIEISISLAVGSVFFEAQLDKASKLSLALDVVCDSLRIRETIKIWEIPSDVDKWESAANPLGLIPNALINNGLILDLSLVVTNPQPEKGNQLACDTNGGVIARRRIPISSRGEAPLFPIQFSQRNPGSDPIWQVTLDLEEGLGVPASKALRVFVSENTEFAKSLKSTRDSTEYKLALGVLIHAISDEILRRVLSDEDTYSELNTTNAKIQGLEDQHWAKDEASIGYLLLTKTLQHCKGSSILALAENYRLNPSNFATDVRKNSLGKLL